MKLTGTVMKASSETRSLTQKDGSKRTATVNHVLLSVTDGEDVEIVNLRSYDAEWPLPKTGTKWTSPRIRRYESYDGMIAEVTA